MIITNYQWVTRRLILNECELYIIRWMTYGLLLINGILTWVHIAISNSKSLMKNIYHGIKPEFLQEYLNEFCYKFNRRYFGDKLFDRLMIASIACTSEFEHRIYSRNLSAGCG